MALLDPEPSAEPEAEFVKDVKDTGTKAERGTGASLRGGPRATGPGRLLVLVYAVFALSASARAGFQIATKFDEAPVAYLLSAFAAAVYVVATISLAQRGRRWYWISLVAVLVELVGVLVIGVAGILDPAAFPHDTVWTGFGRGYGFVPLLLPILGLIWLYRTRPLTVRSAESSDHAGS
ncbi:hypothetical protein ODZ83_10875 [Acaricomes phytoseiuli]|uniref:hypothetical protein n=1 Tax=Acaricomes phytoseiuli TaxID=291968 RepID=UPI00035D40E5|nr:hypothetical protein [Acaricomes phytoseiuli]MCW1250664.1 hypothetical protein [Acaricomes phytoseiuli]